MYPFFQSPPTSAPSLSWDKQRFLGAPQKSKPGGPAGGCQAPRRRTPFEQSIHQQPHPFSPSPHPRQTGLSAPSPRLGPGWQPKPEPPPRRGLERGSRRGLRSRRPPQPAPGRVSPADNGSGSSASRTRREKNKAGGGRRRRAWGPPPSPLCLPETPALEVLLSPVSSEPRSPIYPTQTRGTEWPPIHERRPEGAGGRGPRGWGAQAGDRCPPWPRLTLRAGGLRRRLAGSPGGAAEQQPQQR